MEKDTRNKVDPEMAGVRLASQELCDNTEPWAGAQAPANKGKESPKQDWSNIIKWWKHVALMYFQSVLVCEGLVYLKVGRNKHTVQGR